MLKILALIACASCGGDPEVSSSPMPWLHGFTVTESSDVLNPAISQRMGELDGDRADDGYGGIQLGVDLAPNEAAKTVLASYRDGVFVLDQSGHVLARSPGFDPTGSSDDLIALAVGDGLLGVPMLALAVNIGGHRESTTSIVLYRVGTGHLNRLFIGPVEQHDGDQTLTGSITLLPKALVYQAPGARTATLWTFDSKLGRYVELQLVKPTPHDVAPSGEQGNVTSRRV